MRGLELAVALAVPIAIMTPHLLPLHAVAPGTAAAIWLLALALRALVGVGAAIFVFVYLPQASFFDAITDWCLHNLMPLLGADLGLSGHRLAHAAVILPALALAASVLWILCALTKAAVTVNLHLRHHAAGPGPLGSFVVRDRDLVVAVAGVGRPRVVVSDAVLRAMDEGELAASVAHERGHISHRHRPLLVLGSILGALGRSLPGTRRAEHELAFNLERDADEYAVATTNDPLALASAICKVGESKRPEPGLARLQGRSGIGLRLDYLLSGGRARGGRMLETSVRVLALAMLTMTVALVASLPSWAVAAPTGDTGVRQADNCPH